jgi:16S rRNA (guanine527-N7)-methyltransferase
MNDFQILKKYFPELTNFQLSQFERLPALYAEWNEKINVISRKDIENIWIHHILHSLAIAHFIKFKPDTEILDIGTGGGFPGIPLAIFFPECKFTLADSIGKKIKVVNEVALAVGLQNVKAIHSRAEAIDQQFDFIVSRATAPLNDLVYWSKGKIKKQSNHTLKNGLIALKGGDINEEIKLHVKKITLKLLTDSFEEPFFETKKLVYLPL